MKNIIYVLFLLIILIFSCHKKEDVNKDSHLKLETSELKFENKSFVRSYNDCVPNTENCTYILFEYTIVSEGPFKDEINNTIVDEIIRTSQDFLNTEEIKTIDNICETFLKNYSSFKKANPKIEYFWMMEVRGKNENYNPKILCYSISNVNFMGGAHPNTKFRYLNFDRRTGKLLTLNDIFTVGFENKLNSILDKLIRKNYFIKEDDDLREKIGLYENKIEFNNNFAITKNGLKFYYNPYEIAPYSVGFLEIIIPYSELEEILPPNSRARP